MRELEFLNVKRSSEDLFVEINHRSELMHEELGRQIRERRILSGRSIRDLGDELNMSHPYISQLERNQRGSITIDTLIKFATAFGTTPSQILTDVERSIEKKIGSKF